MEKVRDDVILLFSLTRRVPLIRGSWCGLGGSMELQPK